MRLTTQNSKIQCQNHVGSSISHQSFDLWCTKPSKSRPIATFLSDAKVSNTTGRISPRILLREVGPYIDRLLMMLEEQPLRFILDCRSFEELVGGGVIATWFERSPRRTLDMHRFPLLPRKTQKLFKSIFSFLKQARNRPLSRTQPFDVQIVLLPDTGSDHAEYVAPEVCRLAWQDNLSISVARKKLWPQGLKKPFSYLWDESSYRKVWEGFSDTVYRHPRTRPAARRLPEPSEEEWTRDWLGDAAA
jgi:hypothetical protein